MPFWTMILLFAHLTATFYPSCDLDLWDTMHTAFVFVKHNAVQSNPANSDDLEAKGSAKNTIWYFVS